MVVKVNPESANRLFAIVEKDREPTPVLLSLKNHAVETVLQNVDVSRGDSVLGGVPPPARGRHRTWPLIVGCFASWISVACISGTQTEDANRYASCRGECESNGWPRMIVGVIGAEGTADVVLRVESERLGVVRGKADCPTPLNTSRYVCTASYGAHTEDSILELTVVRDTRQWNFSVPLTAYNSCGREIAYVEAILVDAEVTIGSPRYISPCAEPL